MSPRKLRIFSIALAAAVSAIPSAPAAPADQTGSARIAARYKQMLEKNPAEGMALDRLWTLAQESGATAQLLGEYKAAAESGGFAGVLVYGHLLRKAGSLEEARAAYEKAAAAEPRSALPRLALAKLAAKQGRAADAAREWEKAVALTPAGDPRLAEMLIETGNAWLAANEPAKAAAALEHATAQKPDDLALRQRLAEICEKNGLPEKAAAHWQWIAAHGDAAQSARAEQNLARVFQSAGNTDAALAALEKALALTAPGNWLREGLQAQIIRLSQRAGREAELEARWKKAVEENPRDIAGWLQLTDFYERTGDAKQARSALEKLCALAPKNADYKLRLARVCEDMGDRRRAAALLDELIAARPADSDLVFERAGLDLQQNAAAAARARIEELLKRAPGDEALAARAIAWFEENHLPESAEQHLRENAARDETGAGALALAGWYFAQRRPEDARRVLQQLAETQQQRRQPPEAKAAALSRIADVFKNNADMQDAALMLRRAAELLPRSPEPRLALADALLAAGRFDDAQTAAEQAFSLAPDDAGRVRADQKLFQIFQAGGPRGDGAAAAAGPFEPASRRGLLALAPPPGAGAGAENRALAKFIAGLAQAAAQSPSAEKFLRVAQWQLWSRNYRAALDFARRAIALEPRSAAAHELAEKAAEADGQRPAAISFLQTLRKLDPKNSAAYALRIGRLELVSGRFDEALRIFTDAEAAHPGDVAALTDLALAQQAADRWYDALATWQRAFDASPPAKKREIAEPLLRVMERLGLFQKGAELLLGTLDAQPDDRARETSLQDLLAFCSRHDLRAWLETEFVKRRRARPDDYFTATALAKILRADGRAGEALRVLADAAFSAPDEAEPLAELAREAEELGNPRAAAQFQRRVAALSPRGDPAALEKLAALQEADLDIDGANKTWGRICESFPRDAAALDDAAAYFLRWGDDARAREILRRLRALDPRRVSALLALARVAERSGTADGAPEALSCCEEILENTPPARPDAPLKIPAVQPADVARLKYEYASALRMRHGAPTAQTIALLRSLGAPDAGEPAGLPEGGNDARLVAIREASQILAGMGNEAAMRAWLARWDAAESRAEALWAFYYSGATDRALAELRAMLGRAPEDARVKQAFIWLALQMGAFDALRDWLAAPARTALDRDMLLAVAGQFLEGKPGSAIAAKLAFTVFSGSWLSGWTLWQSAQLFASQGHPREAAQLGSRALAAGLADPAASAVTVAHWQLYLGEEAAALETLRGAARRSGDALDAPVYAALRESYLLLPAEERAAFADLAEHRLDQAREPLHAAISMLLLRALRGDEPGAQAWVARLLALRPVTAQTPENPGDSAHRFWTFILAAGLQLQRWKFDRLAVRYWEGALADPAAIRLQGAQAENIAREVRARLFAARLVSADGFDADAMIEKYASERPPGETAVAASLLQNNGTTALWAQLCRAMWERDRMNPLLLRMALSACQVAGDMDAAKAMLREINTIPDAPPAMKREAALRLSTALEASPDGRALAQECVQAALAALPNDPQLLEREAQLQDRAGRLEEAADAYRRLLTADPGNRAARVALAGVLERAKKPAEAIAVLAQDAAPDTDAKLAELYLDAGQPEEAFARAEKVLRGRNTLAVVNLAESLARKSAGRKLALRLLLGAISQTKEPDAAFGLEMKFVEQLAAENPRLARQRLRRLQISVESFPELESDFFDLESRIAPALGLDFQKLMEEEWDAGRGSAAAGARLVWLLAEKNPAKVEATLTVLLARDDVEESDLQYADVGLRRASRFDLVARVEAELCRRFPLNDEHPRDFAATLHTLGRDAEALRETQRLALRQVFNDHIAAEVAPLFYDLGDRDAAREMFAAAVADDPGARNPNTFFGYARLLREAGEIEPALDILRRAFRNPATGDVGEIVRFYVNTGRLARLEDEAPSFHLSEKRTRALFAKLFALYAMRDAPEAAVRLLEKHPEIAAGEAVLPWLPRVAEGDAARLARITGVLEAAAAQSPGSPASKRIARALAQLHGGIAGAAAREGAE